MSKRQRFFFPQDEREYQQELEETSKEWRVMSLYNDAVRNGYTPDKENKITVVDPSGDYKIEFRAIKDGKVHKVVMKDIRNKIDRHYIVANNQRHGFYMESKDGKIVKIGNYRYDKPYGKLCEWNDKEDDFKLVKCFD